MVSKLLRNIDHPIREREDMRQYYGIGKNINDHIHEFLTTGKVKRLEELRQIT